MDSSIIDSRKSSRRIKRCSCTAEILIVDDNIFNLIPLRMMLQENFHLDVD